MKLKSTLLLGAFVACVLGLSSYANLGDGDKLPKEFKLNANDTTDIKSFEKSILKIPFDNPSDNADFNSTAKFYTWSWEKFLYYTQKKLYTNTQKFNYQEYVFMEELIQVDDFAEELVGYEIAKAFDIKKISNELYEKFVDVLEPENGKPLFLILDEQADGAILTTQNDYKVFYSIHADKKFVDDMTKKAEMLIGSYGPFQVYNNDTLKLINEDQFNIGSTELKLAWADPSHINSPIEKNAFKKKAMIFKVVKDEQKRNKEYQLIDIKEMAIVGFHLAGVVKGHPEFIWSTFELDNLAPNQISYKDTVRANADKNFTFTQKGKITNQKGIDKMDTTSAKSRNRNNNMIEPNKLFHSTPLGVRYKDDMTFKNDQDSAIYKLTKDINYFVNNKYKNIPYKLTGSIWAHSNIDKKNLDKINLSKDSYDKKDKDKQNVGAGSMACFNITLETSFQEKYVEVKDKYTNVTSIELKRRNCFNCHGVDKKYEFAENNTKWVNVYSWLNTSHIFRKQVEKQIKDIQKNNTTNPTSPFEITPEKENIRKRSILEMSKL